MYLDDLSTLPAILQNSHFTILITEVDIQKTCTSFFSLIPIPLSEKGTHDIEAIRRIETLARAKYTTPRTILLEDADKLTLAAQNAFLKLLEEPNTNVSFVLVAPTSTPFLPTILSRAKLFYLRDNATNQPPDTTTLAQARTLVAGNPRDIIQLANILAKSRPQALEVARTAIHQLHQSQLKAPNPGFLKRLEKLIALEKALESNGHIKLHIVNMVQ